MTAWMHDIHRANGLPILWVAFGHCVSRPASSAGDFVTSVRKRFVHLIPAHLPFTLLFFSVLMAADVLIPIGLKRYVFPRLGWLDRITS